MEIIKEEQINNSAVTETVPAAENKNNKTEVLTVGDWMITILITGLPLIGLVMLFVWAFSRGENPSKRNWAVANLAWLAIGAILAFIIFGGMIMALFSN